MNNTTMKPKHVTSVFKYLWEFTKHEASLMKRKMNYAFGYLDFVRRDRNQLLVDDEEAVLMLQFTASHFILFACFVVELIFIMLVRVPYTHTVYLLAKLRGRKDASS